jgi:ankyrin repeat protein
LSENASSASRTPSPFGSDGPGAEYDDEYSEQQSAATGQRGSKRKHDQADLDGIPDDLLEGGQSGAAVYARMILDYFVSESAQIPSFLISPPADFDPNVVIDDDGHTALHWACAMGRIRIVKLLLTAGADIFRANAMGQTALMRSVMFTNNYDLRKFPELFELLHRSTINIDRNDRTVFHYVIDIALQKGKAHAARYYLEVILDRLKEYPREVSDILNFQDEEGETALTLAARARSKNLVRMLLNHGADGKIANRDGKSAEDYILEDERFKNSNDEPALDPRGIDEGFPAETYAEPVQEQYPYAHEPLQPVLSGPPYPEQRQPVQPVTSNGYYAVPVPTLGAGPSRLHFSESGQRVTAQIAPQINSRLEALAATFDAELEEREKDIAQAHALILGIEAESVESARVASELQSQASGLGEAREREAQLQLELKDRLGKRFRLGWEKYVRDEEERQKAFVGISKGDGKATILGEAPADVEGIFGALPANGSDELAAAVKASADRLATLKAHRKELCDSFVQIQMEAGTADSKVNEYRKLIALGCGIAVDEVDAEFISTVLEQLDNEEEAT